MSSLTNKPEGSRASSDLALEYSEPDDSKLSNKQQQKKDALEFAELIYDIFKGGLSNNPANINSISRKDNTNV
jgi:hypothetical protein